LTIRATGGAASGSVVLDNPTHSDRIFEVDGGDVTIDRLAIIGGSAESGGGIYASSATLTVEDSTISGNSGATYSGGITALNSDLTVSNTTVSGNAVNGSHGSVGCIS